MKEIETTTIYDEEIIKNFLNYFYFDRTKIVRLILNILILVVIIHFITLDHTTIMDYITFIICIFGIIEINSSILPRLNFYKLKKRDKQTISSKIKYTFKSNNFKVTIDNDKYINYKDLYKVIEKDNVYYLYINKSHAYILSKKDLKQSEIEKLTKIFKEKVPTYKSIN